jgi:hypothetical protein
MSTNPNFIIRTAKELWELAGYFYKVDFLKGKSQAKSTGDIFFILMMAQDLGMTPTQGLLNIAIIHGQPCVWGDVMLALVYGSGLLEKHEETINGDLEQGTAEAVCTVKRKDHNPATVTFSTQDAKRAGLWLYGRKDLGRGSVKPWNTYPLRMLTMRARGFALRNNFPDTLKGLQLREEVEDYKQLPKKEAPKKQLPKKETPKPTKPTKPLVKKLTKTIFDERYLIDNDTGDYHLESGKIYTDGDVKELMKIKTKENQEKYHDNKEITQNMYIKHMKKPLEDY